jgi:tRNA-modifying protein YgfZ
MNEQWQSFISNYSTHTFNCAHLDKGCLFDLSHSDALLEFTGDDAKTFLQGQLTNDINDINNEISQLSGYCNPKGRLLTLFRIFSIEDKIYLQLPAPLLTKIKKRMKMFVMMSKVNIKEVSAELINIALAGDNITSLLKQHFDGLTAQDNHVITQNGLTIITIAGETPGVVPQYQCIGSYEAMQPFCSQLFSNNIALIDNNGWTQLNIQAGLPSVGEKTIESFVPQMLNLHRLNAINFKKGCYTGQEVVARLHYLGKSKRAMYQIKFATDNIAEAGDSLFSPESNSGQGAGNIVLASQLSNSAPNSLSNKEILVLAVVETSSVEKNAIFLDEAHSIKGTIVELPYSLDED